MYVPEGASEAVRSARTFDDGATLAWTGFDGAHTIWLREGTSHRLVYGEPRPSHAPFHALVSAGDRVIAVGAFGESEVVFADRTEPMQLEPPAGIILHAAFDSAKTELLIAGADGAEAWIGRAALEGGSIEVLASAPVAPLRRVQEISPGVFLLLTEEERLFLLSNEELEAIPLEWDDPTTEDVEREVDPACGARLLDIAARDGRGYVEGCGGTLFDVHATSPPRAQRIASSRFAPASMLPDLASVTAFCADDAIFAARGIADTRLERGEIWELAPLDRIEDCPSPHLGRCLVTADRAGSVSRYPSGTPAAMAVDGEAALAIFNAGAHRGGSAQRIGTDGRYRFPEALIRVAGAPWGGFVVATSFGQLLVSR